MTASTQKRRYPFKHANAEKRNRFPPTKTSTKIIVYTATLAMQLHSGWICPDLWSLVTMLEVTQKLSFFTRKAAFMPKHTWDIGIAISPYT